MIDGVCMVAGSLNLEQTSGDDGVDSGLCAICGGLGIGGYISYDRKLTRLDASCIREWRVLGLVLYMQRMMIWIAHSQ